MNSRSYDAIVVGSGPNGLSAAITLQQAGLRVLLLEAKSDTGGGLRSAELSLPGFIHDVCSAVHPLAALSPFFKTLPLQEHGLEFVYPPVAAAHPFDEGDAATLQPSLEKTANALGADSQVYTNLLAPLVKNWPAIDTDLLSPLHFPEHPLHMARFGYHALQSASRLAKLFQTKQMRGLWAGMSAHGMQAFSNATSAAVGLVLLASGHLKGWPFIKGGSGKLAGALIAYFKELGGEVQTNVNVQTLSDLPSSRAVLLDLTPRQMLRLGGTSFSKLYRLRLSHYRYGMGVFKIDWALDAPIPFTAAACREAGTVHLGNSWEEIAVAERQVAAGKMPAKPFVLLAQPSLFDATRAPAGKHTAWAYCHVPNGSTVDRTAAIEEQVERFAPGFRKSILARHTMNTSQLETYNPNYVGGDINGGLMDAAQLFTRPVLSISPYRTGAKGIYICSSSTPPGGGVHGMCGHHAGRQALKDVFHIAAKPLK